MSGLQSRDGTRRIREETNHQRTYTTYRTIKLMSLCTKTCRYFACSFNSMRRYPKLNQTNLHILLFQKLQILLFQDPRVFLFKQTKSKLSLPQESSFLKLDMLYKNTLDKSLFYHCHGGSHSCHKGSHLLP